MSYINRPRPIHQRARARARRRGMGDDATDNIMLAEQQHCSDPDAYASDPVCWGFFPNGAPTAPPSDTELCRQAAAAASAPFDAKISDLSKNWNPSGFYSPDQITKLVGATMQLVNAASNIVGSARSDWSGSQSDLANEQDRLNDKGKQAIDFQAAVRDAMAKSINVLDAPGLKRWVVNSMEAASSARDTVFVVSCQKPWWVTVLQVFQAAFDVLWSLVKGLVEIVVKVGETILKIPDTIGTVITVVKYAFAAAAGYYAWTLFDDYKHKKYKRTR